MSEIVVRKLVDLPEVQSQIDDIFFESSTKKEFKDQAEKEAFHWKYVGFYLKNFPELTLVAYADKLLGYILGSPSTRREDLYLIQPHLSIFEDLFELFPAHLHINCHFEARGLGIGGKLLEAFEAELKTAGVKGLHIMTGTESLNRNFYIKHGFHFQEVRSFQGNPILFMGKNL
ncbi:MAG: GNAT family N-acetyltransferase [Bacteriovoracaceae bacterium]